MSKFKKNTTLYNSLFVVLGVIIIGFGVAVLIRAGLGTDPFTCLNMGLSKLTGISFGTCQLCSNLIIFLFPLIYSRKTIGIGTVANMVLVGYSTDFFGYLFGFLPEKSPVEEFLLMIIGILICSYGVAMYMEGNMGVAPYDCLGVIISKKFNKNYGMVRMFQDLICVIMGFILGGTVGISTVLTALVMGYIINYYRKKIHHMFFE